MSDIEWLKRKALFACKCDECAEEYSFSITHLRLSLVDQRPICEDCYDEEERHSTIDDDGDVTNWDELPAFDPFAAVQADLAAMTAERDALRAALKSIERKSGPGWGLHM